MKQSEANMFVLDAKWCRHGRQGASVSSAWIRAAAHRTSRREAKAEVLDLIHEASEARAAARVEQASAMRAYVTGFGPVA